jgi:hypothetical protein
MSMHGQLHVDPLTSVLVAHLLQRVKGLGGDRASYQAADDKDG